MSLNNDKASLFSKGPTGGAKTGGTTTIGTAKPNAGSTSTTRATTSNTSAVLAAAKAKKVVEAEEYKAKAENYLKTSFMQWKPDYIAAATMYERSADFYKQAEDPAAAYTIMLKAAECHEGYNAMASVAVAYTKAAQYHKEMGPNLETRTSELLASAAEFWGLSGDLAKYGETLAKAAKELENADAKGAHALYKKAMGVLCPQNQPKSPIAPDIIRNIFSFLVRNRLLDDALAFAPDMVQIFQICKLETAVYKVLASVTVIQLAQGDAVKAQQTYLQEHLNVPGYLSSRECELADNLTMAFSANDLEKLDKAKRSPEMHYLDFDVQSLGKTLSLFDACFTDDSHVEKLPSLPKPSHTATATDSTSGKGDLFAKPAPKGASSPAHNKPPPPPLPAAPAANDFGEYDGSDNEGPADLGEVDIPQDDSDAEEAEEQVEVAPEEPVEEEDEDEIDLS